MMKVTMAAVAAVMFGSLVSSSSFAAPIYIGNFTTQAGSNSGIYGLPGASGTFVQDFEFNIAGPAQLTASITNAVTASQFSIDGLTLSLFSGSTPSNGAAIATATASTAGAGQQQTATLNASFLSGFYYLELSGTTGGTPSPAGSISFAVSAVPLPSALPLFGSAVLGLVGAGFAAGRRRAALAG